MGEIYIDFFQRCALPGPSLFHSLLSIESISLIRSNEYRVGIIEDCGFYGVVVGPSSCTKSCQGLFLGKCHYTLGQVDGLLCRRAVMFLLRIPASFSIVVWESCRSFPLE